MGSGFLANILLDVAILFFTLWLFRRVGSTFNYTTKESMLAAMGFLICLTMYYNIYIAAFHQSLILDRLDLCGRSKACIDSNPLTHA